MSNLLDDYLVTKAPKNPFGKDENDQAAPIGTTVTGKVLEVVIRQVTDIQTREPQTWPDGNPKNQAVITLQTDLRDPADAEDDGKRNVYVKLWGLQKQALVEATRAAGGSPAPGDTFTATFAGVGKKTNPAFSAPKVFQYKVVKGAPLDSALGVQTVNSTPSAPTEQFPPALTDAQKSLALQLINVGGQTDEQIAQIVNAPANLIEGLRTPVSDQIRLQAAAASGSGF